MQDVGDAPLGLFQLMDGDDLVYSTWASGSAYRVRVWSVRGGHLAQVLEASTRDRPEFVTGRDGAPEVRTTEADGGTQPRRTVVWRYDGAAFQRIEQTP
ncbi:hypothetical protein [Phenylobacterium sp. J367]|uniref:hypothetical protein n=1 Tax=Phenylobacterium sp. J367 TaxID=2898435 RepID=UPI002151BE2E|nr:hypothetical protein [Phenylobacterium sp. J367]MCR5877738.1 hypothetical protein [Phenylobacterium sp. J367]